MPNDLLTISEVARLHGVTPASVKNWLRRRTHPLPHETRDGTRLIRRSDAEAMPRLPAVRPWTEP